MDYKALMDLHGLLTELDVHYACRVVPAEFEHEHHDLLQEVMELVEIETQKAYKRLKIVPET